MAFLCTDFIKAIYTISMVFRKAKVNWIYIFIVKLNLHFVQNKWHYLILANSNMSIYMSINHNTILGCFQTGCIHPFNAKYLSVYKLLM